MLLEVMVDTEDTNVRWFNGEKEIVQAERSRLARVQILSDGCKRSLLIKRCQPEDGGKICVRTNADQSATQLLVKCGLAVLS